MTATSRSRGAARLQHHALQSLLAVRPLERLYAGQARREGSPTVLVRQLLLGLPDEERAESSASFERHFGRLATLTMSGCLPLRERLDVGQGSFYLVCDAPRGSTIGELVRHAGPLPVATVARIALDVVDLLLHARGAGVHHFALHRGNVLIAPSGAVTVLDLGLAPFFLERLAGRLQRVHPAWDSLFPEPPALAPEVIASEPLGEHTDIYGVGGLIYLLLTGALPYSGAAMVAYNAILAGRTSTDPRDLAPQTDTELASLVVACLKRSPTDRPASLEVVRAVLAPLAAPAESAFDGYRLALSDRPWVERFEPLLRLLDKDGAPEAELEEPGVVVPLFQVAGRPMSDVELLSRMSSDQRRIYLAGGSAMTRASRRTELRRGMLLGVAIAVVAVLVFGPRLLDGLGLFGGDVPVISDRAWLEVAPLRAREAEPTEAHQERRSLVLYVPEAP